MNRDMYKDRILAHYRNPLNYGGLDNADYSHTGVNPSCGDEISVDVQVQNGTITDIGFTGDGCAISMASASLVTEELTGAELDRIQTLDRDEVLELLEIELTPMRVKCAILIEKVLTDAISQCSDE